MTQSSHSDENENLDLYQSVLYGPTALQLRIEQMAKELIVTYKGKRPLFVCLLRGGAPFAARLMFAITKIDPHFHPELDYMTVRSYGDSRHVHEPEIVMNLSPRTDPKNRPAIILDDVYDTGVTATLTAIELKQRGATEISTYVLVKKQKTQVEFPGKFVYGFDAPAGWLTGMGLDDVRIAPEANRWGEYIALAHDVE
jgi:hypoxanthine phosphoribosyltransferase